LSRVADHDRAKGAKKIFFHRFFPSFRGAHIHPEQFLAYDGAVQGFETTHKLLDKIINSEAGLPLTRCVPDREAQDQESSRDGSAVTAHSHARAKGAAKPEGCLAIQLITLTETG
jgi:hypothetical protein